MKIGVFGANGFVGRSLCLRFLKESNIVYAFYNKQFSLIPDGCVRVSMASDFELILDCIIIAIGGQGLTYEEYRAQYLVVEKIVNKYHYKKIVFISSVEVYGRPNGRISFNSPFVDPNVYGHSKICQEFIVKSLQDFIIIRPTYLYGNGMNENSIIPIWINKVKKKMNLEVYGDGSREQDYLHVDDLAQLCFLAVTRYVKNCTVIAASGLSISNYTIAESICFNSISSRVEFTGQDNTPSSRFDISLTKELFGWTPSCFLIDWLKEIPKNESFDL